MAKIAYALLLGFVGAVLFHILLLLTQPQAHRFDTWQRIEAAIPAFQFSKLPKSDPIAQTSDPLFSFALCHFELSDTPLAIRATGHPSFWSLSLYNTDGENIYSINAHTTPGEKVNFIFGNPLQIMELNNDDDNDNGNDAPVIVTQNLNQGFVILRSFVPDPSWKKQSEEFLLNANCSPIKN